MEGWWGGWWGGWWEEDMAEVPAKVILVLLSPMAAREVPKSDIFRMSFSAMRMLWWCGEDMHM